MKNLFLAVILAFSLSALAGGKIEVKVPLTAGSFQIESSKVKGKLVKSGKGYKGSKFSVKVKDLKTGMDLRDEHTRKRISSKKHKKIIVTKIKASGGKGKGMISIKGVKKAFKFTYEVSGKMMKAKFKINLPKFKIKDISYMGIGVDDNVFVKANIPIK